MGKKITERDRGDWRREERREKLGFSGSPGGGFKGERTVVEMVVRCDVRSQRRAHALLVRLKKTTGKSDLCLFDRCVAVSPLLLFLCASLPCLFFFFSHQSENFEINKM
jgi:hypothetical protein